MIKITLPDGSVREYSKGTTSHQVALSISEGLARNVLAAKINNVVQDALLPLDSDCTLQLLTWNDTEGKQTMWHSSAHLLADFNAKIQKQKLANIVLVLDRQAMKAVALLLLRTEEEGVLSLDNDSTIRLAF